MIRQNSPSELSAPDQVQAMIDGLPNAEEITFKITPKKSRHNEAIDEAEGALDDEIDELDMTRYAGLLTAALGALAAPMLLANDSPNEQFSLAPGGSCYFDLSAVGIPSTVNVLRRIVPCTILRFHLCSGTVDASVIWRGDHQSNMHTTSYAHSLFIADYNAVTHTVSWDDLILRGPDFRQELCRKAAWTIPCAPSVEVTLPVRAIPKRGVPQSNRWDRMLDKDEGHIKHWVICIHWGRMLFWRRVATVAVRGCDSARYWIASMLRTPTRASVFRPVLEVMNPDTLGSDGLKVVTLDLSGGKLGGSSDAIHIIVKNGGKFTAPASDSLTRPDGNTGSYFYVAWQRW